MNAHIQTICFVFGIVLGILCGEMFIYASEVAVISLMLGLVQGCIYFFGKRKEWNSVIRGGAVDTSSYYRIPLITLLLSFGIFLGILRTQFVVEKNIFICTTACEYQATIISSVKTKNQYQIFTVHNTSLGDDFYDVEITTPLYPRYSVGDTLTLSGKVSEIQNVFPHTDTNNTISSFDYISYTHMKDIGSSMFYPKIERVDSVADTFPYFLMKWKEELVSRVSLYVDAPASTLASGMLFGVSSFSQEFSDTFRVAGLSHIVVLSGFNIVIIISFMMVLLTFLPRNIRIIMAGVSVILFVCMVGVSASVVRATLMASISLLAMISGRVYVAKQALVVSLFLSSMYSPETLIHDVSLHLSFLATVGIVYMSEPLLLFLKSTRMKRLPKFFQELFVTSFSAYSMTLPYVVYMFGSVSVYALIANILVVPFVPLGMLLSFLVVLFSYVSETFSFIVGFLDTAMLEIIIFIAQTIEHMPYASLKVEVSLFGVIVLYCCIAVLVKYISVSYHDETLVTKRDDVLEGLVSY